MRQTKEAYIERLQTLLNEWYCEIETLKQQAVGATAEKRDGYATRLANLRVQCEAAKEQIEELHQSQDTGWDELRAGADQMWTEIKQLVKETREAFQEGQREADKCT